MKNPLKTIICFIIDLFFPLKCIKCHGLILRDIGQTGTPGRVNGEKDPFKDLFKNYFCPDCIRLKYEPFAPPFCGICGERFEHDSLHSRLCHGCMDASGIISKVRAGAFYSGIIKESIHALKYQKKTALAKPLGEILFKGFNRYFDPFDIDVIMPVPLHISKLKQRGFNQAFLVAKDINRILKNRGISLEIGFDLYSLKRVKKTAPQIDFSRDQRKENVKDAFKVMKPERIKNKKILLVDDVYTTGATSREAAKELFKAGALQVDVLVVARA